MTWDDFIIKYDLTEQEFYACLIFWATLRIGKAQNLIPMRVMK